LIPMDDSRFNRNKQVPSRKASKQEPSHIEWACSSRSPPPVQHYSTKNLQGADREKFIAAQQQDVNGIHQLSQGQNGKTKRNITPSSYLAEKNLRFDPPMVHADRSRNNSPTNKSRSPLSGRRTPQQVEKITLRPQSRAQDVYVRENNEKQTNISHNYNPKYRRGSNPHCVGNESYYIPRNLDSGKKENKLEIDKDIMPETVRLNHSKQIWGASDSGDLSISNFLNKRSPNAVAIRDQQQMIREKKISLMLQHPNEAGYSSKIDDRNVILQDLARYQDPQELKLGAGLSRDAQRMGLALKKESASQKVWRDKSQELRVAPQFHTPVNKKFVAQVVENREPVKHIAVEERPLGTEEFFEDFFHTQKMTFDFEKTRVSRRPNDQKDHYTPERPASYSNTAKNHPSNREMPIAVSHRPQENRNIRPRYLE